MIIVHHLERSRSHRIVWLLEELGVPYEMKIYPRDPKTKLAPPELKQVHPLGKSPVITDGNVTMAESGAILEYLADTYGPQAPAELGGLKPPLGTPAHHQYNYWMHYAEGSLMPSLVMKLVFSTIPNQPMPFFVRPIAKKICSTMETGFIDPGIANHLKFVDDHLAKSPWFAGDKISVADFQMSFPVLAALIRSEAAQRFEHLKAFAQRIEARPAFQRAQEKGGPVVMT